MAEKTTVPVKTKVGAALVPERLKFLDKSEYFAVLATDDGGEPYVSLVAYAFTPDLKCLLFATPRKTAKYRNMVKSKRVSLLIDSRSRMQKGLMDMEAVTLVGDARVVRRDASWETMAGPLLLKHPDLEEFVRSPSTALIAVTLVRCVHVSQFQTVTSWACAPDRERK